MNFGIKLDPMDLKTPVLAETAPMNKSRLSISSGLMPYSPPSQQSIFTPSLSLSIPRKKTGVLEDVRAASWLDSMKASSPPPKKLTFDADADADQDSSDADVAYRAWMVDLLRPLFFLGYG